MAYHRHHGVDTRIVRIFNTYGPRMRAGDGRVVPTFICQALAGEPLTVFGDGSQTRSFCFVDDLIEGIWRLLNSDYVRAGEHRQPGGDDGARSSPRRSSAIDRARRPRSIFEPLPEDDPKVRQPDITLARRCSAGSRRSSLPNGLEETIEFFSD